MRTATLTRTETSDQGMFGCIVTNSGLAGLNFCTGESPRLFIPSGTYQVQWKNHPINGWRYELVGVAGRDRILIHPANFCGDIARGYRSELKGCIALGLSIGELANQKALLRSRSAVSRFQSNFLQQPFELTIVDDY